MINRGCSDIVMSTGSAAAGIGAGIGEFLSSAIPGFSDAASAARGLRAASWAVSILAVVGIGILIANYVAKR